jgi:hypothetical protein
VAWRSKQPGVLDLSSPAVAAVPGRG